LAEFAPVASEDDDDGGYRIHRVSSRFPTEFGLVESDRAPASMSPRVPSIASDYNLVTIQHVR
jgi:hypothetical protein